MSLKAYKATQTATEDPRVTEYRLFGQVTGALLNAKQSNASGSPLVEAVDWNRRVWRTLAADCMDDRNKLTADVATARFSPATNLVEQAVAEDHVTLEQITPGQTVRATAQRAVYTTAIDQVKLTGTPVARTDKYLITDADYMIWRPKTNRFSAFGLYQIIPLQTNQLSLRR